MIRRRRETRHARERWVFGATAPLARALASQTAMAAITPRVARIIDLIDLQPGKSFLDIGCGTAAFAHLIAARAGCDEPPVTLDLVPGPGPVDAYCLPEHLPIRDDSMDCVTCLYYIRRFDDDAVHALGNEIRRILKPGGAALVLEVAPMKSALLDRAHRWLLRPGCQQVDLRGWGRLAALFTEVGFDAIDLVNVGPFLLPPIPRVGVLLRRA